VKSRLTVVGNIVHNEVRWADAAGNRKSGGLRATRIVMNSLPLSPPTDSILTWIPVVKSALGTTAGNVPAGKFITTLGDLNTTQFAEMRLPTMQELDQSLPRHPYRTLTAGLQPTFCIRAFIQSTRQRIASIANR